jgi:small membrane protein
VNWIQALLIVSVVTLLVYLLRSRGTAQARAWVKVGFVLFVLAGIYAILRPNDTTVVANWVGVARGTDLMEYILIVAFAFTTLSTYLRFKEIELRYARLARAIALEGAQAPDHDGPASVSATSRHRSDSHQRINAGSRRPSGSRRRRAPPAGASPAPRRPG